jgi:hypothetical protein
MAENQVLEMMTDILTGNKLPQQVFSKKYQCYLFGDFDEAVINQKLSFLQIIHQLIKLEDSQRFLILDIREDKIVKSMDIESSIYDAGEIASFLDTYKDEHGTPYFNLIASALLFTDNNGSFAAYCDRSGDTCVVGCSRAGREILLEHVEGNKPDKKFLYFRELEAYIQERSYFVDEFKSALLSNYK